jgi:dCTP deaminase
MAFWSGATLELRLPSLIEPFRPSYVDCNACTLHMGGQYYRSVDAGSDARIETLKEGDSLTIPAGQFAFLLTAETVEVPTEAIAFISMKTGMKFSGLVNVSGFHVDPGFKGPLKFAVFNAGPSPVVIKQGDDCFLIWYADLDDGADAKHAKTPSQNEKYKRGITGPDVRGISGAVMSLSVLAKKVEALDATQSWMKVLLYAFTFVSAIVLATVTLLTNEGLKSFLKQGVSWMRLLD